MSITPLGDYALNVIKEKTHATRAATGNSAALDIIDIQADNLHYQLGEAREAVERIRELIAQFEADAAQDPDACLDYQTAADRVREALGNVSRAGTTADAVSNWLSDLAEHMH